MYKATQLGRDNFQLYQDYMGEVANQDFFMLYQPKMSREANTIAAAEALIRWRKSANKVIYLGDLILIIEDSDLIIGVGEYVICQAIINLAKSLSLKTGAEGVATIEQIDTLSDLGCDLF